MGNTVFAAVRFGNARTGAGRRAFRASWKPKSAVVIAALNAYIAAHPELAEPAPVSVKIDGGIRREALEQMIRSIIDERIANGQLLAGGVETPSIQMQEDLNVDIAAMISNLELFDG